MSTVTLFSSRETPVEWRSVVPGVVLTAGVKNKVEIKLKDTPDTGDGVVMSPGSVKITLRRMGDMSLTLLEFEKMPVSGSSESLSIQIPIPVDFTRGYYRLHLIKYDSNDEPEAVYDAWAVVDQSTEPQRDNHMELSSIRTQFADLAGEDNKLLGSLEVGVGDVAEAVERCLSQWVATAPRTSRYYGDTFPYPELLRNGVMSMLLESICSYLNRNRMVYQAEGVNVDLERRVDTYKQMHMTYDAKWRSGMMQMKNEENVESFSGGVRYW